MTTLERNPDAQPSRAPGSVEAPGGALQAEWRRLKSRYAALWDVTIDDGPEEVRLIGRAPSQHLRQLALAVACRASGTKRVVDEVRVAKIAARNASPDGPEPSPE